MSIQAVVGLPGHGKSYSAVELFLLPALKSGRQVVTNIPLTDVVHADYPEAQITSIDLDVARHDASIWDSIPGGSLVFLDELWRIWPAGLKPNEIPLRQLSFIKEHRHYLSADGVEMDIVLVTQDMGDIATAIRGMVEVTIICLKRIDIGAKGYFRRDYYRGSVKGQTGPKAQFLRSDHKCRYQNSVWKYYQSHTKSDAHLSVGGNEGVVSASIFSSWGFRGMVISLLVILVSLYFLVRSTMGGVSRYLSPPVPVVVSPPVPAAVLSPVPAAVLSPVPVSAPAPKLSEKYQLVARYVDRLGRTVYMIHDGWRTRKISSKLCQQDISDQYYCLMDGEIIASWTGRRDVVLSPMQTDQMITTSDIKAVSTMSK